MAKDSRTARARPASRTLAGLIRLHREALGLSQNELARRSGVSPGAVNRIESGDIRQPKILARLADALGIGLSETVAVAAERPERDVLPTFTAYLRTKYGELPPDAHRDLERYFARVQRRYGVAAHDTTPEPPTQT